MGCSQLEAKLAVDCGYWSLYRFQPQGETNEKPAFILDSKEPTGNFREFLLGEVRYSSLQKQFPAQAEELFAKTEADARQRLEKYQSLAR